MFHEMLSDVLDVKVWTLSNLTRLGNALCKMGFRRTRTGAYVRKVGYIPPVVVHCVESFSAVAADALTSEELKRVDGLREALGVPGAAKRLGVSPTSLLRVLASAPVHRGTVLLLRQALIALGEPGTSEDKL